jgi:uncharacterized protein (TIGR03067 family)
MLVAALLLVTPFASGAGDKKEKAGGKKKGDLELVQGSWLLISVEVDGKQLSAKDVDPFTAIFMSKGVEFVVAGEKVLLKVPPGKLPEGELPPAITFKINPKARPKSVDISVKHKVDGEAITAKGIYALEGNRLTLCLSNPGVARPTEFKTKGHKDWVLGVFKRKGK